MANTTPSRFKIPGSTTAGEGLQNFALKALEQGRIFIVLHLL
jgi:hypothetical protein